MTAAHNIAALYVSQEFSREIIESAAALIEAAIAPTGHAPPITATPGLGGVFAMSDWTGMFQHAIGVVPDRRHGYCLDDNARALMLMNVAAGLTERSVQHLETEAERRPELAEIAAPLRRELEQLRRDMHAAARGESAENNPDVSATSIRGRANSLVLRATQADLAASKGAGFITGHPAERAVREAMFFLVWSCPQPVVAAALRGFACLAEA